MAKSWQGSLHRYLDPDLMSQIGDNPLRVISIQRARNNAKGNVSPEPPVFSYAHGIRQIRDLHREIEERKRPSFLRELPVDRSSRIFMQEREYSNLGPKRKKLLARFAARLSTFTSFATGSNLSAGDYFSMLSSNAKLSDPGRRSLRKLQEGNGNRGPGLGPTNERRAALALAILKDKGLIRDFQICGEAGKPLALRAEAVEKPIDYTAHEEAMAVDILVQLQSSPNNIYLPLQIKSSGNDGYDQTKRYLTFSRDEKNYLQTKYPQIREYFVEDPYKPSRYRLKFQRKVLKLALNERKIVKSGKKDFEPDIVNKIMAMIEYAQGQGEALLVHRPYQKYSYPEKVLAMIKAGFLKPILDADHELDF